MSRSVLSDTTGYSSPLPSTSAIETVEVTQIDKFLGDAEISKLMNAVRLSTTVRRMTLRGNCIGPTGAFTIASVLKDNVHLTLLSLEWNQILSEGAVKIAEALETNSSLTSLDLRNNSIGDDGAKAIANALLTNKTLRSLDLRWNQVTDKGALAFREALLNRKPPIKLSINGNLIGDNAMTSVEVWSSTGRDYEPETDLKPADTSQDSTLRAQYDVLQKELQELRSKLSSHQSDTLDVKRQLDVSAVRITELEQQCVREEFTVRSLDESLKQAKESISILTEEKRSMMNAWELERSRILDETKYMMLAKDAEILHLKGERDAASDVKLKLQVRCSSDTGSDRA
jgi:Ran GTPase-activating protein (RanGAP) involved in mRNA processing and transport